MENANWNFAVMLAWLDRVSKMPTHYYPQSLLTFRQPHSHKVDDSFLLAQELCYRRFWNCECRRFNSISPLSDPCLFLLLPQFSARLRGPHALCSATVHCNLTPMTT